MEQQPQQSETVPISFAEAVNQATRQASLLYQSIHVSAVRRARMRELRDYEKTLKAEVRKDAMFPNQALRDAEVARRLDEEPAARDLRDQIEELLTTEDQLRVEAELAGGLHRAICSFSHTASGAPGSVSYPTPDQ